jgi:hypothetical protein
MTSALLLDECVCTILIPLSLFDEDKRVGKELGSMLISRAQIDFAEDDEYARLRYVDKAEDALNAALHQLFLDTKMFLPQKVEIVTPGDAEDTSLTHTIECAIRFEGDTEVFVIDWVMKLSRSIK